MAEKTGNDTKKKKGFFGKLFDKLDKRMQEKAKSCGPCCQGQSKDGSCCS